MRIENRLASDERSGRQKVQGPDEVRVMLELHPRGWGLGGLQMSWESAGTPCGGTSGLASGSRMADPVGARGWPGGSSGWKLSSGATAGTPKWSARSCRSSTVWRYRCERWSERFRPTDAICMQRRRRRCASRRHPASNCRRTLGRCGS